MRYKLFTLRELVTIKYGKNQKKVQSDDGSIPIYGTGGLMGYATDPICVMTYLQLYLQFIKKISTLPPCVTPSCQN